MTLSGRLASATTGSPASSPPHRRCVSVPVGPLPPLSTGVVSRGRARQGGAECVRLQHSRGCLSPRAPLCRSPLGDRPRPGSCARRGGLRGKPGPCPTRLTVPAAPALRAAASLIYNTRTGSQQQHWQLQRVPTRAAPPRPPSAASVRACSRRRVRLRRRVMEERGRSRTRRVTRGS